MATRIGTSVLGKCRHCGDDVEFLWNRGRRLDNISCDLCGEWNRSTACQTLGLTRAEYQSLFLRQRGRCAICQKPETRRTADRRRTVLLSVDHDHETGKVRALLCQRCNTAVGMVKEDPEIAWVLFCYLRAFSPRTDAIHKYIPDNIVRRY